MHIWEFLPGYLTLEVEEPVKVRLSEGPSFEVPRCLSGHFLRSVDIRRSSIYWMAVRRQGFKPRPLRSVRQDLTIQISCGLELVDGCLEFRDVVRRLECDVSATRRPQVSIPRQVLAPGPTTDFLTSVQTDGNGNQTVQRPRRSSKVWSTFLRRTIC